MTATTEYLSQITKAYTAGNATEHTYRPALKVFVQSMQTGITATNEPRRESCGAPDYIVTKGKTPLGYIEAKDIGKPLAQVERTEQLKRYLESLSNLILTDYLEFRWYVDGEHRATARLASIINGKIKVEKDGEQQITDLLKSFMNATVATVNSPRELATRMAAIARLIRDTIQTAFDTEEQDDEATPLHGQLEGFRQVLIHDLTPQQFADMYAQTICYGMFAASCNHDAGPFTRQNAGYELPKTNPFLRKLFNHIAGADLDERIVWAVDDVAELLNRTDIEAILKDFGKRTRQEDPVVHFYESFLAAYDQKMREARGVYYTPEPVVSYIVRSVDSLLKTAFKLSDGLADYSKVKTTIASTNKQTEVHKVQILDPATGTGTFLHGVVDCIQEAVKAGNAGAWSGYVSQHLLPRMHGFELLMAPYAVAHMKLSLQLKQSGYDFQSAERIRVYLTNSLEEAHAMTGLPLFTQWIADEANAASSIKQDAPVMVIVGNPPYSGHSANTGDWIKNLLRGSDTQNNAKTGNYFEVDGLPLGERNPKWLNDDYVKFIRFAQWRIEQTGYGILAFICNHSYLDNPTFRGMRQSLMNSFDDIYILDLHGNARKKETAPDGSKDENVFDIQQGTAIGIFIRKDRSAGEKKVRHADLHGLRSGKYAYLNQESITTTQWSELSPQAPFYLFMPQDQKLSDEYGAYYRIAKIMNVNVLGFQSHRDNFAIDFDMSTIRKRIRDMQDTSITDDAFRDKYGLKDNGIWQTASARKLLRNDSNWQSRFITCSYRPFDNRACYFSQAVMDRPRCELMDHVAGKKNLVLNIPRIVKKEWKHVFITGFPPTAIIIDINGSYSFPLYRYPETEIETKTANFTPSFLAGITAKLKLTYIPDGKGDLITTFGPEDIFNYMYAVFHSPTYRSRYCEFLKIDFPRLPLTSNIELFRQLCKKGEALTGLHLMDSRGQRITGYPIAGDNTVEKVRYQEPYPHPVSSTGDGATTKGRVWINTTQYFDGVPQDVWEFQVGGYQVCEKWLKDRKGRHLTFDDISHYQQVVSALSETIRIMTEVDEIIENHGGWPIG